MGVARVKLQLMVVCLLPVLYLALDGFCCQFFEWDTRVLRVLALRVVSSSTSRLDDSFGICYN